MAWADEQKWEMAWWRQCQNTYYEEQKQLDYAPKMGLTVPWDSQGPYIDGEGKSIIDIGAGPVSLLLKYRNTKEMVVVDPGEYPQWVWERYNAAGIEVWNIKAEELITTRHFDEALMYNVLQHTENPKEIVRRVRAITKLIRVFDWLEVGVAPGHPWNLHEAEMNTWFGGEGHVEKGRVGYSYSGIFKGDLYDK